MTMEGTGIVPVMDINQSRNFVGDGCGMYGGGMWFLWIIVLFALMGGWGNGWNRNGADGMAAAALANDSLRNDINNGFNNQDTQNGIRGIQQGLCDGFYAVNTGLLQGFNGIQRDLCQGFNAVSSAVAENRFAAQQCCCETNRNIDAVRYENAQNTCAITTNATHNTQKILDKLCQMESNAKDAQIADLREKLAVSNLQVSQQVQNATLINALRPFPQPAYITTSPYQSVAYGFNACNSTCPCNC